MAIVFLLLFACTCYGWGRMARLCLRSGQGTFAYDLALGIAVLSAVGGLLNLLSIVSPVTLHVTTALGTAATLFFLGRAARGKGTASLSPNLRDGNLLPVLTAVLLTAFFAWALLPTAAFNLWDDLHTYVVRAVRMVHTGSLGGNPFDALGIDGFGAQSFFHAFVLAWCPVTYLNAFDGVFCFGLCALLIVSIARQLELNWLYAALALVVFVSIPPQIVNISPVYSGTAMILGLAIASAHFARSFETQEFTWKTAVPIALFAACLVSLKSTLALFAAAQLAIFFVILLWRMPVQRRVLAGALYAGIGTFLLVLPWLISVVITYDAARDVADRTGVHAVDPAAKASILAREISKLSVPGELFYGGHTMSYNFMVLWVLGLGIVALCSIVRARKRTVSLPWLATSAATACSLPVLYILNAHLFGTETGIRYSCPLILAAFPLVSLIATGLLARVEAPAADPAGSTTKPRRIGPILQLGANLAIVFLFLATTATRMQRLVYARTQVAYKLAQEYLDFHQVLLSKPTLDYLQAIQARVQPGEGILVWTDMPFFLDYKRNPIFTASDPGIINPLLRFPVGADLEDLQKYIRSFGIRYVLFQSEGPSITGVSEHTALRDRPGPPVYRKMAIYNIYAKRALMTLSERNRVLFQNERHVLYEFTTPDGPAPQRMTQGIEDAGHN